MAKKKAIQTSQRKMPPALTPEARQNQLIALAVDRAEQQLLDGTASSQVITHYLKLASTREKLEREKIELENKLLVAKTESIHAAKETDKLYREALEAMKRYSGS